MRKIAGWSTILGLGLAGLMGLTGACGGSGDAGGTTALTDAQLDNLVRRSYPFVAMYNVNNKFAMSQGGWNTVKADTQLKDHTLTSIARPNNDTLYISCLLDLRAEPMIIEFPAFDSDYVSLMVTAYDHYVNVPLTSRLGDFRQPGKILLYTVRTGGYDGSAVEGVDTTFEASGDFVSAVFRVMPHATDPDRFARILQQMQQVRAYPLSTLLGSSPRTAPDPGFPEVGVTNLDVFANNLLPVMQFAFNHTTFDPSDPIDTAVLAALEPLGVSPGQGFDPQRVAKIDGDRIRSIAERITKAELESSADASSGDQDLTRLFRPKGKMTAEDLLHQSVVGPIGLPASEAVYPAIHTADGKPMNALHDYVIRIPAAAMPPAKAFWSITLYDTANGFFIPNPRKKYSVGRNAGMKLDPDGGIAVYVAAEQPEGVPLENWLPIERKDLGIDLILRIYVPDLEAMKTWQVPVAEQIGE